MAEPSLTIASRAFPRWWVRGDLDGFLGLGLDNLIQILLIVALCRGVLAYPDELIFATILPATGVSLVVGNLAYALQAHRLGRREGRDDRTALPYGINTVSLFAYVFLVMLPVKLAATGQGMDPQAAALLSWRAGLLACLFQQARPQRNRRRLTLALPRWSLPRRGRVHAMERYCNDAEGRG